MGETKFLILHQFMKCRKSYMITIDNLNFYVSERTTCRISACFIVLLDKLRKTKYSQYT